MDFKCIEEKLSSLNPLESGYIKEVSCQIVATVKADALKIIDLVQNLDPILTSGSHEIRSRGVQILVQVVVSLPKDYLLEKELKVLTEFLCLRLIDHSSMEEPALRCLSYFVDCANKPERYNKNLLDYFKSKINIRGMSSHNRGLIYEIIKKMVLEKYHLTGTLDCEFVYSLVGLMDGESDPKNLLLCYGIVSFILKNFKDLEPYTDDLFEWLSSYYPIDYTPNTSDENFNIQKSDLVEALYDCFYANELNSENLQTLLLEKLDSNLVSTKLESLKCLVKCYQLFPVKTIKSYTTSIWNPIRMECLKKLNTLDLTLAKACYETLGALATKLSEDEEFYYRFIFDLHEELSIAFRKPELDLFEPAARLISHAVQPKLKGFNYILDKILPLASNAIEANELRPTSGLAYIFEQLTIHHPGSQLSQDINVNLDKIAQQLIPHMGSNQEALRFMNALIDFGVKFDEKTLDNIVEKLFQMLDSKLDLESCLAKICINYKKTEILFGERKPESCTIEQLMNSVLFYQNLSEFKDLDVIKFSTYLRVVTMLSHRSECPAVNSLKLDDIDNFLTILRELLIKLKDSPSIVSHIANIHGILLNKLKEDLVEPLLMKLFASNYCQGLLSPNDPNRATYIQLLKLVLKSLVIRNNNLSTALTNLILNYMTSENVDEKSALEAGRCFRYVLIPDCSLKFTTQNHYQVFAIYKQKFYMQSCKEIKIRYEKEARLAKKYILISALASQIPHLAPSVYKRDYEWLLRELMQLLINLQDGSPEVDENLIAIIYECIISLMQHDTSGNLEGLLDSLINLNLKFSTKAKTLEVRRRSLGCLALMATLYKQTDLLVMRTTVVDKLRDCLSDKKRLVRQAAADARLKWTLIGQPIGS